PEGRLVVEAPREGREIELPLRVDLLAKALEQGDAERQAQATPRNLGQLLGPRCHAVVQRARSRWAVVPLGAPERLVRQDADVAAEDALHTLRPAHSAEPVAPARQETTGRHERSRPRGGD